MAGPVDAGGRLQTVVNQVAQAEADVVRLLDGLQSRPVAVNVGQQEDTHEGNGPLLGERDFLTGAFSLEYTR
jgi:hypothetical protein